MRKESMNHKQRTAALAVVLALALVGCGAKATAPTPPQITVATANNALAQALDAATIGLIAARDAGTISQANLTDAFAVIKPIATPGPKVNAELRSKDSWTMQKISIGIIAAQAGLDPLMAKLSPNARAIAA